MSDPTQPGVRTEADVDTRIVMPYLAALGIQPNQIRAQHTFSLRLGRGMIHNKRLPVQQGRLDYLIVDADNRPLFLVELKGPGEALSNDDRDQAISYARLVHPIAPLVLVANDVEHRLYDTVTRERLGNPAAAALIHGGGRLTDDESLRVRAEALEHFIGYSAEHVAAFSSAQRASRMETLRGSGAHTHKYETDLYLRRSAVRAAFEEFLGSSRPVFALIGLSGFGKTNEMCALAEEAGESHVTLFFNGADLAGPLPKVLADEFDWHFSESLPLPQVCRRLAALGARSGHPALIIIDAVDEVADSHFPRELGELARHLDTFGGSIRLVVSAKPYEWWRFTETRGNPSVLRSRVFVPRGDTPGAHSSEEKEAATAASPVSAFVGRFTPAEQIVALERYSTAFGIADPWLYRVRELAGDPFMLRMVTDVAATGSAVPLDPRERELVRRYVEEKVRRAVDPERAHRELIAVASALADISAAAANLSARRVTGVLSIPESEVRRVAGLPSTAAVAQELVAFGVLLRSPDRDGGARLAFAYDRVRDYMLATHGFRLPDTPGQGFRDTATMCFSSDVGTSALEWYLPYTTDEQWQGFLSAATSQVERLVDAYESIRDCVAPPIRARLDPRDAARIGAAFSGQQPNHFALGFFRRETEDLPRVVFDPAVGHFFDRGDGARTIIPRRLMGKRRGTAGFWFLRDPELHACTHFKAELEQVVKDGGLVEAQETLVEERVVALAITLASKLGLRQQASRTTRRFADHFIGRDLFPLDLRRLDDAVQVELALHSYKDAHLRQQYEKELQRLRALGEAPATVHYNSDWTLADLRAWKERAVRDVQEGRRFTRTARGDDDLRLLASSIEDLLNRKAVLEDPLLPPADAPDSDPVSGVHNFEEGYSDEQLARLIETIVERGLDAYEGILADSLTPHLRSLFPPAPALVAVMCRRRTIDPDRYSQFSASLDWGGAEPADDSALDGRRAVAIVVDGWESDRIQPVDRTGWNPEFLLTTSGGRIRVRVQRYTEFASLVSPDDAPGFAGSGSDPAARIAPVRATAYERIQDALKEMSPEQFRPLLDRSGE